MSKKYLFLIIGGFIVFGIFFLLSTIIEEFALSGYLIGFLIGFLSLIIVLIVYDNRSKISNWFKIAEDGNMLNSKNLGIIRDNVIRSFDSDFRFLSNFFESNFTIEGVVYKTVEHYFQSMKAYDKKERDLIINAPTPGKAKSLGRKCILRADWEKIKDDVMEKGVCAKFDQNKKLRDKLEATGKFKLEEGNVWKDKYWGVDQYTRIGENHLGKLLMKIRKEYLNG